MVHRTIATEIDKTELLTDEQFYYLFSHFKSFFYQLENQDLDCKTNVEVLCLSSSKNFVMNSTEWIFFSLAL